VHAVTAIAVISASDIVIIFPQHIIITIVIMILSDVIDYLFDPPTVIGFAVAVLATLYYYSTNTYGFMISKGFLRKKRLSGCLVLTYRLATDHGFV